MNNRLENIIIQLENRYIHNNNLQQANIQQPENIENKDNRSCIDKVRVSSMVIILFIAIITPVYVLVIYDGTFNRSTFTLINTTYSCSLNKLNTIDIQVEGRTSLNEVINTVINTNINMTDYRVVSLLDKYVYFDRDHQEDVFYRYITMYLCFIMGTLSMIILDRVCDTSRERA